MLRKTISIATLALMLATTATPSYAGDRTLGTVIGAVGGAAVGSAFGKGGGKPVAIAVGALVGAGIGNQIARNDHNRNDRYRGGYGGYHNYHDSRDYRPYRYDHGRGYYNRGRYSYTSYSTTYVPYPVYPAYAPANSYWVDPGSVSNVQVNNYVGQPAAQPVAAQQYCREFNQSVTIGGQVQPSYGTACLQPDGSWAIQN